MSQLEQLIKLVTANRWGLHPIKVAIALLLPLLIVWAADWRIRRLSRAAEARTRTPVGADPADRALGG